MEVCLEALSLSSTYFCRNKHYTFIYDLLFSPISSAKTQATSILFMAISLVHSSEPRPKKEHNKICCTNEKEKE